MGSLGAAVVLAAVGLSGCGGHHRDRRTPTTATRATPPPTSTIATSPSQPFFSPAPQGGPYRVAPLVDPHNVYAADGAGMLSPVVRRDRSLVYVPNSASGTVDEIDPQTYRVIRHFEVGQVPQHIVPSYDLRTLWVTNDESNTLTAINPRNGRPGRTVTVADPYNLYFTPDGRDAVVMAERLRQIDFRDAQTMRLRHVIDVPECAGVNHADYTADGRRMLVSCEFASVMVVVDVPSERVIKTIRLPARASPQDVKLAPDGRIFYVADLTYGGVWKINARTFRRIGLIKTGAGAHGLYPSRDALFLYVSDRESGDVAVIRFATQNVVADWKIPGGSPDMGGVSADGRVLWLSGRYDAAVYAISTTTGKLIRRIPVGLGPHGVCVFPQPGRYSLGHTGVYR
jgi:DNA-binding beta-propeller fold protein YncE